MIPSPHRSCLLPLSTHLFPLPIRWFPRFYHYTRFPPSLHLVSCLLPFDSCSSPADTSVLGHSVRRYAPGCVYRSVVVPSISAFSRHQRPCQWFSRLLFSSPMLFPSAPRTILEQPEGHRCGIIQQDGLSTTRDLYQSGLTEWVSRFSFTWRRYKKNPGN